MMESLLKKKLKNAETRKNLLLNSKININEKSY
jgi:hypothetical protein